LRPEDLSVLAAVGCDPVRVVRRPRVHLATTGDELVPATQRPQQGQIREGNTLYLGAALQGLGVELHSHGIVPDDARVLREVFAQALDQGDALVTTGGVSMGKYDLVGAVLEDLGVRAVLHKIAIKPGKPLWFGMAGSKPVFGLPGNPVSCLVGFELFLRRALAKLAGENPPPANQEALPRGRWTGSSVAANPREQHFPVRVRLGEDGLYQLEPLAWRSSADIVGITRADALACIPAQQAAEPGMWLSWRTLR
jgi:molybdopterin molybdotransferase